MPSKRRRPFPPVQQNGRNANPGRHATVLNTNRANRGNGLSVDDILHTQQIVHNGTNAAVDAPPFPSPDVNGNGATANGTASHSLPPITVMDAPTNGRYPGTEKTIHHMWQASEAAVPHPRLQPRPAQSLRRITAHRSRSALWTTLGVVALTAAMTVALVMFFGDSAQSNAEVRAAVLDAATAAAGSVEDSMSTLESLRAESSFTPQLVSSISALGDASRSLVESAAGLPTNEPSLAEVRMTATALAGRVSRLGETFGAAFSYRGQLHPHLNLPALSDPLDILNLSENADLLTDWQFRLEQAASTRPGHTRLLRNQQALQATLPYIAVHRQAYTDAVGNGQSEQADAALSQLGSLLSAISHDFDRAYGEIAETAEAEIQSLTVDLHSLSEGT